MQFERFKCSKVKDEKLFMGQILLMQTKLISLDKSNL